MEQEGASRHTWLGASRCSSGGKAHLTPRPMALGGRTGAQRPGAWRMARPRKGQQASERQEHGKGQALPEHVYTLVCACARARVFTCAGGGGVCACEPQPSPASSCLREGADSTRLSALVTPGARGRQGQSACWGGAGGEPRGCRSPRDPGNLPSASLPAPSLAGRGGRARGGLQRPHEASGGPGPGLQQTPGV